MAFATANYDSGYEIKLPVKYSKVPYTERWKVRELYAKMQNGRCYYCHAQLNGPPTQTVSNKKVTPHFYPEGFFNSPVHLHHNHVTDLTIGIVHAHCNAVLWEYEGE